LFAIAGVFFVVFLLLELLQKHPFVDLRLYWATGSLLWRLWRRSCSTRYSIGANFLVALMLQQAFHYTPFHAGLMLAPGAAVMGVVGPWGAVAWWISWTLVD